MIVLTETTDNLQVVLGALHTTNSLECVASWRDISAVAAGSYTPGRTLIDTNGTTDVNIVDAPGASTQRVIDLVSVYNADTVSQTVTIKLDANGTEYIIWVGTLASGETVQYINGYGFQRIDAVGQCVIETPILANDVQIFTAPGAGTWVKPTWFEPKLVMVICVGAGGGGGGGASSSGAAGPRWGGCGGGGGAWAIRYYTAGDLGTTEAVSVGTGGTGGAGGVAAGAAGSDGGVGGNSSFRAAGASQFVGYGGGGGMGGGLTAVAGYGGGGGGTGSAGATGTGSAGTGGLPGVITGGGSSGGCGGNSNTGAGYAEYGGGGGAAHSSTTLYAGSQSIFGGGGGGDGGCISATPAVVAPTYGGVSGFADANKGYGGLPGVSGPFPIPGFAGNPGVSSHAGCGGGGGGGTYTAATSGAAGGAGGAPGGGGGGGGHGMTSGANVGGDGGDGGDGQVRVYTW